MLLLDDHCELLDERPQPALLEYLYQKTLMEAGRLIKQARKTPESAEHMLRLREVARHLGEMISRKDYHKTGKINKVDPQQIYDIIKTEWGKWVGQGISQERYEEIIATLDEIRALWAESPQGPHKLGPHEYFTEAENLVGYVNQWFTSGTVGSASKYERRPGFGSQKWINAPDSSATAGPEPGKKEKPHKPSEGPGKWENPHTRGQDVVHPNEDVEMVAAAITEDIADSWGVIAEDNFQPPIHRARQYYLFKYFDQGGRERFIEFAGTNAKTALESLQHELPIENDDIIGIWAPDGTICDYPFRTSELL